MPLAAATPHDRFDRGTNADAQRDAQPEVSYRSPDAGPDRNADDDPNAKCLTAVPHVPRLPHHTGRGASLCL